MEKRQYVAPLIVKWASYSNDVIMTSAHDILVGNHEFGERIFEEFFP